MRMIPFWRSLRWLLFGCVYLSFSYGQNILIVEHHKVPTPVRGAAGSRPIVEINGKRVVASGDRYALKKVPEFFPLFVSIRHVDVKTTYVQLLDTGGSINNQFEFRGEFVSPYRIENVFFVLELEFEGGSKSIFLHEIGNLEPRRAKSLSLAFPMGFPLGSGKFQFHVFSDGRELLHSEQPFAFREAMLDGMIARRIQDRKDGPPQLFLGPSPEYPRKLAKSKVKGQVVVRARIRTNGALVDPVVIESTDPAFSEAALESLRQWRFLPAIKDGRPVEKMVSLPLAFDPIEPDEQR